MRSAFLWSLALLCGLPLLLAACDAAPGLPPAKDAAPVLSDFTYAPDSLDVAGLGEQVRDGVAEVPLELEVTARDPEGALREVGYIVRSPLPAAEPLKAGTLQPVGGGGTDRYRIRTTLQIPTAETGLYTLRVLALDEEGQPSNQVIGSLVFAASGREPVIEEVIAPEQVERPSTGATPVVLVAVVSDPDGLANVSRVRFWNVNVPAAKLSLRDDGQGGDEVAGDGRYTATIQVESTNAAGPTTLAFQATDRSGLESQIVEKTIVVD